VERARERGEREGRGVRERGDGEREETVKRDERQETVERARERGDGERGDGERGDGERGDGERARERGV